MKIEDVKGVKLLVPDSSDFILYSVSRNTYHEKVYLGKNDSMENYREIEKALLEKSDDNKKVEELLEVINKQEAAIADLAAQLAELALLVNKK